MNHYGFAEMFQPKNHVIHMLGTFFNLCWLNEIVISMWFFCVKMKYKNDPSC